MSRPAPDLLKNRLGGVLVMTLGGVAVVLGRDYGLGSLRGMGAGFVPTVIGVLMLAVGLAILLAAGRAPAEAGGDMPVAHDAVDLPLRAQWRGWACIVGGVVAFVVLGRHGGLVPASFGAVFIAALGDRENTLASAAVLAAVVTLFGVAVFWWGLHLAMPLFQW